MKDDDEKTREGLLKELADLRRRVAESEALEVQRRQAEEALRDSERRYRLLAENVTDVIVTTDLDLRPTYLSPSITRLLGFSIEEAMSRTLDECLTPESAEIARKAFRKQLSVTRGRQSLATKPLMLDLQIRCKDGSTIWVESASTLLCDGEGEVAGVQGVLRDITERKKSEEALQDSERRYRLLADNVSDMIWTTDMDLRVTYVSPSDRRMLGYTIDEVKARRMEDLLTPVSLELVVKGFGEVLAAEKRGETSTSWPRTLEIEAVCRDGSTVWIESRASLLRDEGGKAVGVLGVSRDITKRKRAEELFRTLANSSPIGIYIVQQGRFKFVNPRFQEFTGYTENELLGMRSLEYATVADRERVRECAVKMLKGERTLPYEYRIINKSGEPRWVLETVTSVQYEGKQATLGNYMDITDLKSTEEELRQSFVKLQRILEETVNVLASVSEKRDPYTAGHQKRVTKLACAIAREMGVSDDRIEGIRVAGLLHDIGKIYVPAEILSKPGEISDYEYSIIRTHPQVGYDIVKGIEFPWPVARTVLQHHERLNGCGYPLGLRGDEISLEARVLSVADVVEAMSSHRPYRSALGIEKALREVSQNRDILYDPQVVDACLKLFGNGFSFE